jgi:tetratricopeptide (TPR) repeat protein
VKSQLHLFVVIPLLILGGATLAAEGPGATTATQEGIARYKQGRYAEAKAALGTAVAADPKDAAAKAYLALSISSFDRDYDRSVELLEEAVRLEPQRSEFHQWLGSEYGSKAATSSLFKAPGFAKKCGAEMVRAVELDPKDLSAREALMQFYLQAPGFMGGSVDKAHEQAAAIAKLDPCRGFMAEAAIALRAKDAAKAESLYRQAISAAPDRGLPYNGLAYLLLGAKRTEEALVVFEQYVKAVPSDPNAHDSRGEGLLAAGRVDESLTEYQKALALDPWFAASYLGSGRCYEKKGDTKSACAAGRKFLELVPKGRTSDQVRKRLEDLCGKTP